MTGNHHDPSATPANGTAATLGSTSPHPSLVRAYFGTEPRNVLYLLGLVIGVMVLVTVPYVMLVGFGKWSNDMREAGHMIWAGYTPAADWRPLGLTPLRGGSGSVVPAGQLGGPALDDLPRLYVCPRCGTVGMPLWTTGGQPSCPICRGLMSVAPFRPGLDLAAVGSATPTSVPP